MNRLILDQDKKAADKEVREFSKHQRALGLAGVLETAEEAIDAGREFGLSDLALDIVRAITTGQDRYKERHGEYPTNDRAFVDSCLQHGVRVACVAKH